MKIIEFFKRKFAKKNKKDKKDKKDKKENKKRSFFAKPVRKPSFVLKETVINATKVSKPTKPTKPTKITPVAQQKKTAILVGLNYPGSYYSLNGCVNDVKNGNEYLKARGFEARFLEDKDITAAYDVLEVLNELKTNDSKVVFFHYSGHGTQVKDNSSDEMDGKDEALYSKGGHLIVDDDINKILAEFPADKTVFLIFDCCHSGTIADLPYIATENSMKLEKVQKPVKAKIVCVSGCMDAQTSADVSEGGTAYGALSSTLYNILRNADKNKKQFTWHQLYKQLLLEMSYKKYAQIPQLTASDPSLFDQIVKF